MRPDVITNGDDLLDVDPGSRALLDDLAEELSEGVCAIRNERIVLDVSRRHEPCCRFLRLPFVDHQIVHSEDIILVPDGAGIFGIDKNQHSLAPLFQISVTVAAISLRRSDQFATGQRFEGDVRPARRRNVHGRSAESLQHLGPRQPCSAREFARRSQ